MYIIISLCIITWYIIIWWRIKVSHIMNNDSWHKMVSVFSLLIESILSMFSFQIRGLQGIAAALTSRNLWDKGWQRHLSATSCHNIYMSHTCHIPVTYVLHMCYICVDCQQLTYMLHVCGFVRVAAFGGKFRNGEGCLPQKEGNENGN